jgi:hypothetical protein
MKIGDQVVVLDEFSWYAACVGKITDIELNSEKQLIFFVKICESAVK